jgi:hypothetical protein
VWRERLAARLSGDEGSGRALFLTPSFAQFGFDFCFNIVCRKADVAISNKIEYYKRSSDMRRQKQGATVMRIIKKQRRHLENVCASNTDDATRMRILNFEKLGCGILSPHFLKE